MIKTESGRVSKTQLLHMVMVALQGANLSFFTALGFDANTALIVSSILAIGQSVIGAYLRTITDERML